MEMIVISKRMFDTIFESCLSKLSAEKFKVDGYYSDLDNKLSNLHRKFHYEVVGLRDQLERG